MPRWEAGAEEDAQLGDACRGNSAVTAELPSLRGREARLDHGDEDTPGAGRCRMRDRINHGRQESG